MTNTAVTEHYPRLGLFAALIYRAHYLVRGMLRSNAKISQTWSDINLVTAGPRSSSLSALSLVMPALFTASLQISSVGSFSHFSSQTLEDERRIFWQPVPVVNRRNFTELMIHEKPPS